jgi:hypothetical protein
MVSKVTATLGLLTVGILALIAILGTDGTAAAARQLSTSVTGNHAPSDRRLDEGLEMREMEAKNKVTQHVGVWVEASHALDHALVVHLPLHNQLVKATRWTCSENPSMCTVNMEQLWCHPTKNHVVQDHLKCSKIQGQKPPKGRSLKDESPEVQALRKKEEEALQAVDDAAGDLDSAGTKMEDFMAAHLPLYNQVQATRWGCVAEHSCALTIQQIWCNKKRADFNKDIANFLSCNGSVEGETPDRHGGGATGQPR